MKTKIFAAALAAITLATTGVAVAQDYRRDGRYDYSDNRGRGWDDDDRRWGGREIRIRDGRRSFSIDRGDRLFHRVQQSPFLFRPGHTYVYDTDRCQRDGQCRVYEYAPGRRRPTNSMIAPRINARGDRWDDDDHRGRDRDRDGRRYSDQRRDF
jgi:hypothetical protein